MRLSTKRCCSPTPSLPSWTLKNNDANRREIPRSRGQRRPRAGESLQPHGRHPNVPTAPTGTVAFVTFLGVGFILFSGFFFSFFFSLSTLFSSAESWLVNLWRAFSLGRRAGAYFTARDHLGSFNLCARTIIGAARSGPEAQLQLGPARAMVIRQFKCEFERND